MTSELLQRQKRFRHNSDCRPTPFFERTFPEIAVVIGGDHVPPKVEQVVDCTVDSGHLRIAGRV